MKKYLMIVALAALQFSAIAQTVNVHLKNGQIIKYPSSDFDYIDFSAKPTSGDDSIYVHFNAHVPNSLKQPAAKGFGVFSYYDDILFNRMCQFFFPNSIAKNSLRAFFRPQCADSYV